jgi:Fe-S-cluster containining protein
LQVEPYRVFFIPGFDGAIIVNIITDTSKIEELASQKEDENWEFRKYLKGSDFSGHRLDTAVHVLHRWISKRIDCCKCANCCKTCSPILENSDIHQLARHLNLAPADFQQQYLIVDEENDGYCFREMPCPFLRDNLCSIYKQRPADCRSYPHLQKNDFTFRLWQVISNCSVCPIVFNVYEELKARFWQLNRNE